MELYWYKLPVEIDNQVKKFLQTLQILNPI
jgi:hypothetical protein